MLQEGEPCMPSASHLRSPWPQRQSSLESAGISAQATILVVDDQASIRQLVSTLLGNKGYRVIEAADAPEGLRRALEKPPELIISDIMMPVMDGYEFVRLLRAQSATARIPVIFF